MKTNVLIFTAIFSLAMVFQGCEKDSNESYLIQNQQVKDNKSLLNNNKSGDDWAFGHNERLQNLYDEYPDTCDLDSTTANDLYLSEISVELEELEGNQYYDYYSDLYNIHRTNIALQKHLLCGVQDPDMSTDPSIVSDMYNLFMSEVPLILRNEITNTHNDLVNGVINGSNYVTEFDTRRANMVNQLSSSKENLAKIYFDIVEESYEYWMPTSEGGQGNYDLHHPCKVIYSSEMNDNDWPNECDGAVFDVLAHDAIGGMCGFIAGFGWGAVGGAIGGSFGAL